MATVEIPDDVLVALKAEARARLRTDDPSALLEHIVRRYLADVCAPGFDHDPLTGLRRRPALRRRIDACTCGSSWTDRSAYSERFLCIDIDKFRVYLADHGLGEGDKVLRFVADRLRERFGDADVYRVGGDEFIVVLGDREPWLPEAPPNVTFAHTVVDLALHRNAPRGHHVNAWIEVHLDAGIVASTPEGNRIGCADPIWLAEGANP